jgi:hypothetical protein
VKGFLNSGRLIVFGNRQSAIGNRQSAIGNRQSAIGNRQSAIGMEFFGGARYVISPENREPFHVSRLPIHV